MIVANFVSPEAAAKNMLWFKNQAFEFILLNKGSYLAAALGVPDFIVVINMNLVHFVVLLSLTWILSTPIEVLENAEA
jgi:hypothetical protein